jgi:hypothetical protein
MDQPLPPIAMSRSLTITGAAPGYRDGAKGARSQATPRASSGFTAQLLAARHGAAAYRQRRRGSPGEARSAYLTTQALQPGEATRVNIAA